MDDTFKYTFPAIRGIQAKREYYVSMCPMHIIPKLFVFNEEELPANLRAQRILNKGRLPEMARYILDNKGNYTFSAITASIDGEIEFEAMGLGGNEKRLGLLHIPMSSKFIINDGQHRQAAIQMALKENPSLGDETIAVVFFQDIGLERCQQMFADLNRHAIRPSKSLGVLYDFRDDLASITKLVVFQSPLFCKVVDMERSSLSLKSNKLFTLSSIYTANAALLQNIKKNSQEQYADLATTFWINTAKSFEDWQGVMEGKISAGKIRQKFIHSHATALQAIGKVGNYLIKNKDNTEWKSYISKFKSIDWSRDNEDLWEGRAMIGGRISKANYNVTLTANAIKHHLGIKLNADEQLIENKFLKGENGKNKQ